MKKLCTIMITITLLLALITSVAFGAVQGKEKSLAANAEAESRLAVEKATEKVTRVAVTKPTTEATTEETTEESTDETVEETEEVWYDSYDDYSDYGYSYEEETTEAQTYAPAANTSLGQQIVDYAWQWVGVTPYVDATNRWNGSYYNNSLTEGTDCSGFLYLIFGQFGISASPAASSYQYCYTEISYEQLQPGDVVVYNYGGHVALYAGGDMIIHCKTESEGTVYQSMWYGTPTRYVRLIG